MIGRTVLKLLAILLCFVTTSAGFFVAGWHYGEAARFQISLEINAVGDAAGRIAAYESGWNTFDVASAICETRSEKSRITYKHSSFAHAPFEFSCGESGKEQS